MRLCFIQEQSYRWSPPPPPPPPNQNQRSNTNSGKWTTSDDDLLDEMRDLFEEHGPEPLSAWEANFVRDILNRSPNYLSEKQIAVIERILDKLRKCKTSAF
jgi:hypothetical protein